MKRIAFSVLLFALLCLGGCTAENSAIPEGYHNKAEYYENGFQDFADYCRYEYRPTQISLFAEHAAYHIVENDDFEKVRAYIDFFEQRLDRQNRSDVLDFDTQCITQGDYMCLLASKQQDPYYRFTLYYFDTESSTLFYFHNIS